jgi:predicted dehydrogenase
MPESQSTYGLSQQVDSSTVEAPVLNYLPQQPKSYNPKIGLIGAGGITEYHLRAYQQLGLEVAAICDINPERAKARQQEFYPNAQVLTDYQELLKRDDIEVIDAATHPEERSNVIQDCIHARKHVLSQKPFVLNLDRGERLTEHAARNNVKLAVNQNGRWAPHFAYLHAAIQNELIGQVGSIDCQLAFDHSWTVGTPYENIHHLMLLDFGIHWFDLVNLLIGELPVESVFAQVAHTPYQKARPPFLASVIIQAQNLQARLSFNGATVHNQQDSTLLVGSKGTLRSSGPSLSQQTVSLTNHQGNASPTLKGSWFENGFQGTMCELLCSIEENREPSNSARNNLKSLALCFAALKSADTNLPVKPGTVRSIPSPSSL